MDFETRINDLKNRIEKCNHIVFFGGAGVSTESGIPDFRSKDGLYNQHDVNFEGYQPEYLLSHDCLYYESKVFYEFYRQKMDCMDIEPNITHKWLANYEAAGNDITIVTQNIDGLHQKAGSKKVLEIHGTIYKNYCTRCRKTFPPKAIFDSPDAIPMCPECMMGMIRPDVTMYGESLPPAFEEAYKVISKADMLIIAGTSLTVYPAANLVTSYKGNNLIIINRDETTADRFADLVFHESLGEVMSRL